MKGIVSLCEGHLASRNLIQLCQRFFAGNEAQCEIIPGNEGLETKTEGSILLC